MRICLAEDDPPHRYVLESLLTHWGYDVISVADGEAAWQLLQEDDAPEMAILDWTMPGLDGNQVCERVRARGGDRYVYLLLLSAKDKTDDIVLGLEAGADDYLGKPYRPPELRARLMVGERILATQKELIASREELRQQAMRDGLTDIWNRVAIMNLLTSNVSRARREGQPLGILLVDVDHFKHVNDTCGHQAGDAVLRETATRMCNVMRPYDMVGRYGGEEFLVLLPGGDASNSLHFAERLRENVAAEPVVYENNSISISISIGLTVYPGSGKEDVASLLREADLALYQAKRGGRNRVELSMAAALTDVPGNS